MSNLDDLKKKADELAAKARTLTDEHGEKVAQVVDKVTDTIDEKTGGSASAVTAKVDEIVSGAVSTAQQASSTVGQKAGEAVSAVKGAAARKSTDN
ncbi:MAG TPA: hypothetical protein PLT68_04590 [Actinomycetota bacterium]|nr:hypothetical protein [Actinomycetota bacterium]